MPNTKYTQDLTDFTAMGESHNKGLDYMMTYLKANKGTNQLTRQEALKMSNDAGMKYFETLAVGISADAKEEILVKMHAMNKKYMDAILARSKSVEDVLLDEVSSKLTIGQKTFINDIFLILQTSAGSALQGELDDVASRASASLSPQEVNIVLGAISIAKSSSKYWDEHKAEWDEFARQNVSPSFRTQAGAGWVVGADVAAGVVIGVGTSVLFIAPFIGWGLWGTLTGGGAAVVSGATALM